MNGCNAYSLSFNLAIGETGVKRALVTPAQGAQFIVGSCVSIGTGSDRSQATCYDIMNIVPIKSIETVEIDGVQYSALNFDVENTFNTTTALFVITQPWRTGATDDVQGNDGSPINNKSNKEPFKLQGIEVMMGVMECVGSETASQTADEYILYSNRKSSDIVSNAIGTNPATLGQVIKADTALWRYIAELNWQDDPEKYFVPTQYNATSTTGYKDGVYTEPNTQISGLREILLLGYLGNWSLAGLSFLRLNYGLGSASWLIGGRACGSSGNRGEFQA